jgi:hypothetical protein
MPLRNKKEKIAYVYICRNGENEELRYSIRSLANMPPGDVWVVGGKPDWYTGKYIYVNQNDHKYRNAYLNLIAMCKSEEIPDSIVLMNDDFYVVKKIEEIPVFTGGFLIEKQALYKRLAPHSDYTRKLGKTISFLEQRGVDLAVDYELHVPMPMSKKKLLNVIAYSPEVLWRSSYGNMYNVDGQVITDVKVYVYDKMLPKSYNWKTSLYPYLSSDDDSFKIIHEHVLKEMFPDPSPHEKRVKY